MFVSFAAARTSAGEGKASCCVKKDESLKTIDSLEGIDSLVFGWPFRSEIIVICEVARHNQLIDKFLVTAPGNAKGAKNSE